MMPTICRIFFITLFFLSAINIEATNSTTTPSSPEQTIRGRVTDVQTKTPVPGVNVVIAEAD